MQDRHSSIAHAAYIDLLNLLRDEQVSKIQGTPRLETRNGKRYWYDTFRVGTSVKKRYIGEDTPELADRIARQNQLARDQAFATEHRTKLVRTLRAQGIQAMEASVGSLLSAMEQAGAFRLGATIIGTYAFRMYEGELGLPLRQADTTQTNDIDIAQFERLSLSLALNDTVEPSLASTFKDFDFAPVPALFSRSHWRWRQTKSQTMVEFLTPSFRSEEDIRELPALGVAAQSLHFLNFLIAEPIKAAALYRSGVLVQIPRPEAYAIHKLIVANRRTGDTRLKAVKDRQQAALLIRALAEDRPADLKDAYDDAMARGEKWRDHIGASLTRMPESAALIAAL